MGGRKSPFPSLNPATIILPLWLVWELLKVYKLLILICLSYTFVLIPFVIGPHDK